MKKSTLKQIPPKEWDSSWDHLAKLLNKSDISHLADAEIIEVDKEKVLVLSIFSKQHKSLMYRVFTSKSDYLTQYFIDYVKHDFEDFAWRTASLDNLIYYYDDIVLLDDKSTSAMLEFLNSDEVESLVSLHTRIRKQRLAQKHQREKDKIDERMNRVKKLPKNFEKWVEEKALFKSRYIVYKYAARKVLDGYCTHCKTDVKVEGPRHNEKGVCPNCKSPVTYKASGKVQTLMDDVYVALIQKAGDELVTRYFHVTKNYRYERYRNPDLWIREISRDFYTSNGKWKAHSYEWARFKQTDEVRWCKEHGYVNVNPSVLYPSNLKRELKGTRYEYSAIDIYAKEEVDFEFPVWRYLSVYPAFMQLEYFVKMGLTSIASQVLVAPSYEMRIFNMEGKSIKEVLKLSKESINRLVRLNGTFKILTILQEAEKINISLTDKQIYEIKEMYHTDTVFGCLKHTSYHKLHKYLDKQIATYGKGLYNDRIPSYMRTYNDYLRDCEFLGYDLKNDFFLFPKNLQKAHQDTISQVKHKKNEIVTERLGELFDSLNDKFRWEDGEFVVFPPKSHEDLLTEGSKLKHCVAGSYSERMAKGETIILFLRKKDEIKKPFFTIEVSPENYKIRQCRGQNNSNPVDEVKEAVERYEKKLESLKKAS